MFFDDSLERNAQRNPDGLALVCGSTRLTWSQFRQRVLRRAGLLQMSGVRPGDRVAVIARNHPSTAETFFAAARLGAVAVPVNYRLTGGEWDAILRDCTPRVVFVQADFLPRFADVTYKTTAYGIGDQADLPPEEPALESAPPAVDPTARSLDDLVTLIYTSGTTGRVKGAMQTHRNWFHAAVGSILELDIQRDARTLIPAPLYHVGGACSFYGACLRGTTTVFMEEFDPDHLPILIEQERITHTLLIPAMVRFILDGSEARTRNLKSLQYIMYGGSPIREELLREAMTVFSCKFLQGYGMTETIGPVTLLLPEDHASSKLLASCGRPAFGCTVKAGKPGEKAEILVRGESVMKGYWNQPDATREALSGGWLHTKDIATVDERGYVYIVDRKQDMIISGGENIFPREIEQVLVQHPAIQDCAVIGVPHATWGEEVKAVVVLKEPDTATPDGLLKWAQDRLAGYKRPRSVDITHFLPRTPTGKILYRQLREPYWKEQARRV